MICKENISIKSAIILTENALKIANEMGYNDTLVGALGIAGTPGGNIDDEIATKAIELLK